MKVAGNKLAAKQNEIKQAVGVLVVEHPALTATASGQEGVAAALQSLHDDANATLATITEYTCVYVAMTISKNPKLLMANQLGAGVRASLGSALATLTKCRKTNIFKKEVDEIQATLDTVVEDK